MQGRQVPNHLTYGGGNCVSSKLNFRLRLQNTDYKITDYRLQITDYRLQTYDRVVGG